MAGWHRFGLAALALFVATGQGRAQSAGFAPAWTHPSGSEGWTPKNVALGDRGGQVLSQFGPGSDFVRLFSATDANPPSPIWQSTSAQWTYNHRVASADEVDTHVTLHDEQSTSTRRQLFLRKFTSASQTPQWTYVFPIETNTHDSFDVDISRDGRRIAAVTFNMFDGLNDVAILGGDAPTALVYTSVQMLGPFRAMRLSGDGRRLYLASDLKLKVLDTADGSELFSTSIFEQIFEAHGISGDGSLVAYGARNKVRLYGERADGTYEPKLMYEIAGSWICNQLDISDDGSTLACAFVDTTGYRTVRVVALDLVRSLQQGTGVATMQRDVTGAGSFSNYPAAIETSADGRVIAAGLWGDELGQAPEVLVFDRERSTPLHTHDLPGSVKALDLSADGKRLAVASKAVHNNTPGSGGRIDLYDLEDGDLTLHGVPRAGRTVRFELEGNPGSPANLIVSRSESKSGSEHFGVGVLHVDRKSAWVVPIGTFDAHGVARADYALTQAGVGSTLYFQGYQEAPARLSESWIKVTVLP